MVESVRKAAYDAKDMRKRALPCIVEEIAPYYFKRITTLRIIVIMTVERVDVPLVHGFEAVFIPGGLRECAISPLVNAALYLITSGAGLASNLKTLGYVIKPYRREYEGHG